jgi:hypothetical protein
VVMSASWAATSERPVARTATMLLNCMVSDLCDRNRLTCDVGCGSGLRGMKIAVEADAGCLARTRLSDEEDQRDLRLKDGQMCKSRRSIELYL